MPLVELYNVSKTYDHAAAPVHALADASLQIVEREFVALMGPSGSGKSTILSILGAMNPPTCGRVVVDGLDIYGLSVERLADFRREYLGFVFQQLFLVPYLTAVENVMLPLAAARIPNRRQRDMATDALHALGSQTRRPVSHGICRAGSSSAWPSHERSSTLRRCSSRTSRRDASTAGRVARSWMCFSDCAMRA
jgi:ABC-type lipoprotein export system ATPase subunit